MSEFKGTPGPWWAEDGNGRTNPTETGRWYVRAVFPGGDRLGDCLTWVQLEADARLIAAAPDLLRELEETAGWLETRADVLDRVAGATPGATRSAGGERRQVLWDEAARFRARAVLIRMAAERATSP